MEILNFDSESKKINMNGETTPTSLNVKPDTSNAGQTISKGVRLVNCNSDIKYGSVKLMLKPASPGTGIIAGASVRAVMEQVGITDILTKNTGSTNTLNVVKAVEYGLRKLRDPLMITRQRGITLKELFN